MALSGEFRENPKRTILSQAAEVDKSMRKVQRLISEQHKQ